MKVRDLVTVNEAVSKLKVLQPLIPINSPTTINNVMFNIKNVAFHCRNNETHGQKGFVNELKVDMDSRSLFLVI